MSQVAAAVPSTEATTSLPTSTVPSFGQRKDNAILELKKRLKEHSELESNLKASKIWPDEGCA